MRDHCRQWAASRQIQLHGALARSRRSAAPQGRSLLGQHRPHNPSAAGRALCRQPPKPSPHPSCLQASPCAALPPAGHPWVAPQRLAWAAMTGPQQMTWRSTTARPLCHPARPPSPQSQPPPWYACPGLAMALKKRLLHLHFCLVFPPGPSASANALPFVCTGPFMANAYGPAVFAGADWLLTQTPAACLCCRKGYQSFVAHSSVNQRLVSLCLW